MALVAIVFSFCKGGPLLESIWMRMVFFIGMQWLMVIPHELGHALAARWLGFPNIRILIGHGKPFWTGELLGFRWLINRQPFGGLTLSDLDHSRRGPFMLMVAAGPAVSLLAMLAVLPFQTDTGWPSFKTLPGLFFWANALVLIQNLFPHHFQSPYGRLANDGMIILQLLFPRLAEARPNNSGLLRSIALWTLCIVLWACSLLLALIAVMLVYDASDKHLSWPWRIVFAFFFALLATILVILTRRTLAAPRPADPSLPIDQRAGLELLNASIFVRDHRRFAQFQDELNRSGSEQAIAALDARLKDAPRDPLLLILRAGHEAALDRFADALDTLAQIDLSKLTPAARWQIEASRLHALFHQDFPSAEAHCEHILDSSLPADLKVAALDALICASLYRDDLPHLEAMEKWARRAHELAPQQLTTRGTLGAILVELGRHNEAEPHLLACLESPALHDKAISGYYLARLRHAQNNPAEARRLLDQSAFYADLPWLKARAEKLFTQLK